MNKVGRHDTFRYKIKSSYTGTNRGFLSHGVAASHDS